MKRILPLLALLIMSASAQLQNTTPNIQLILPNFQAPNWNVYVNQNFSTIDSVIAGLQLPYAGAWSSSSVYSRGAQVLYNGAIYVSTINANLNNTPGSGSAWQYYLSATGGGGGGGSSPGGLTNAIQVGVGGQFAGYSTFTYNPVTGVFQIGNTVLGPHVSIGPLGTINTSWNLDDTTPATTLNSINGEPGDPTYNVLAYGAIGNGSTNDLAAIQAAFNACWNGGTNPGGTVKFPGNHTYVVQGTIYAYDSCKIDGGGTPITSAGQSPVQITWGGGTASGSIALSGFTIAANSSNPCGGPCYPPHSPAGVHTNFLYTAIFTASNTLSVGNWIHLQGFTAAGVVLNNVVAQVAYATSSEFVIGLPFPPYVPLTGNTVMAGAYTDSGTASPTNVTLAFDDYARYQQEISNLNFGGNGFDTAVWFPRVDAGSRLLNVWAEGATGFAFYMGGGGINFETDNGDRCDPKAARLGVGACVYWRAVAGDNFQLANSTMNKSAAGGPPALMIDAQSCDLANVTGSLSHIDMESDGFTVANGLGNITILPCGASNFIPQISLDLDQVTETQTSSTNNSGFLVSPPSDSQVQLNIINSQINGHTAAQRFNGIPEAARNDMASALGGTGGYAYMPSFNFAPANYTLGISGNPSQSSPFQLLGDVNILNLYHNALEASDFTYADTGLSQFPNGTTLQAGRILAPPAYWNGANGKRYAIDVVYTSGTTGSPNSGGTTCTYPGVSGNSHSMTCSSARDLSIGQYITAGGISTHISKVDATNPSAVIVYTYANMGAVSSGPQALTFTAPTFGPEMQIPTKSAAAPTALAWSQGDTEQNSGATANGIAAWVNVAAGTPGTWAGIPLGNAAGLLSLAQLTTDTTTINGTSCTLGSSCTLLLPLTASLTTTAATSDNVPVSGMTAVGHCMVRPTNSTAASNFAQTYVSAKTTNQITVTHAATASMTFDVICTSY